MKTWTIFVDVVTILWLTVFAVGLITPSEIIADRCNFISLLLLPVFVANLYILFRQADNFRLFIKQRWLDILIVIPYFRLFRVLSFARVIRALKLIKMARLLGITRAVKKTQRTANMVKRTDNKSLNQIGAGAVSPGSDKI